MPSFSQHSKVQLSTCHNALQVVFNTVIKYVDCRVLEGHRDKDMQNILYEMGKTEKQWPNSKHNKPVSRAADVVPCPIDWEDHRRFYLFAGFVLGVASQLGIKLRWGGDWDGDYTWKDQKFHDLPHYEVVED